MKKVLVTGFGLLVSAGSAMGEDVQATKKAAIMTPIENLYGRVEARQTTMQWRDQSDEKQAGIVSYRLVPRIGTKAFKDRLDVYAETPLTNEAKTSNYTESKTYYLAQFALLDTTNYSITPYSDGYLATKETGGYENNLAVNFDAKTSIDLTIGKLTAHGGVEPQLSTGSSPSKSDAVVVQNGQVRLDATNQPEKKSINSQEPSTTIEFIAGLGFTPAAAPKVSLAVDAYFDRTYDPTYEFKTDADGEHADKTGYSVSEKVLTDIALTYKADDTTSFQSLTRVRQKGLYAEGKRQDGETRNPAIEQRISIIQKLF